MNRVLVIALCALFQPAFAQGGPPVDDEVRVTAKKQLFEMRKEIVQAEDRFLAKYNELNKQRQYEIHCWMDKPTGTILARRLCSPEFVTNATEAEAKGFLGGYTQPPASVVVPNQYAGFEKNMVELVKSSPDLARLVLDRAALEKRYNELLKRAFNGEEPKE